ncbi:MAG: hypothetical protein ACLFS5_01865 [Spirochaetaceae bacterium]
MKLRIFQPVAGRRWAYPAGVHDVPDEIAKKLLDAGHAEKVSKGGGGYKKPKAESSEEE